MQGAGRAASFARCHRKGSARSLQSDRRRKRRRRMKDMGAGVALVQKCSQAW